MAISMGAVAALACTPLAAHHSSSTLDITTPVWVKGTIVRYEISNPHTMIELDATTPNGQTVRWTIDGPTPGRVQRMGVGKGLLKRSDVVEVCGFRYKSQVAAHAKTGAAAPPFMHGHLLVMPDGRKQAWGPYGKLNNCVRRNDDVRSWVDFLNNDAIARQLWCLPQRTNVPTAEEAKPGAEEIDRHLATPCE
jgi:hypothetical protein